MSDLTLDRSSGVTSSSIEPSQVLDNARNLHSLLGQHAAENDENGDVAQEVIDALHTAGVIGALTPRELGGAEMMPSQAIRLYESLSYSDPAACWVSMALGFATGLAGAFLERATALELFGAAQPVAIAGQGTRPGTATPVEGGHIISGAWSFASGVKHATHVHTAAVDEVTGQPRFFILPVDQATLIDNWDVLGLAATGSLDYTLENVFVPSNFSYWTLSSEPVTGGDLYRMGVGNLVGIGHAGWALGLGRRLLDELAGLAQAKAGHAGSIAESDAFHGAFAEAEASLRSASALLYQVWDDIEQTVARGDSISVRQGTLNRLALNNATWKLNDISNFVYKFAGTTALRAGTIQRLFRDVHAGTQHISSSPVILQATGRELAGLATGQQWVHFQLKDA